MPPSQSYSRNRATPRMISSVPKPAPIREAVRVARRRSPRQYHSTARRSRPPSRGKPGIRLNTASRALIIPMYQNTPRTGRGHSSRSASRYSA